MRFFRSNKFVFIGLAYLLILSGFAVTWNSWLTKWRTLAPWIAGALIVAGALIAVYWLIERDKLARESRRKERIVSTLRTLRNLLLPWIYHYALALSGHSGLRDDYLANRLVNRRFKDDINLLEYIFEVRAYDSNGNVVCGDYSDIDETIEGYTFHLKTITGSLDYGLRNLEEIEKQISRFPGFLRVGDIGVEKVMFLSNQIRERITELKEWEINYGKERGYRIDSSTSNSTIRSDLKSVGANTLDMMRAIEANLDEFGSE